MNLILSIALGGALGAVSRHLLAERLQHVFGSGFPSGIMIVNILGSFLMGLMISLFATKMNVSQEMRAFVTVGLLGGFTTFSTFSMETVLLIERGQAGLAMGYAAGSVLLAIGGLLGGLWLGRLVS